MGAIQVEAGRAGHGPGEAGCRDPAPRRAAGRAAPAPLMASAWPARVRRSNSDRHRSHRRGAGPVPLGARLPARRWRSDSTTSTSSCGALGRRRQSGSSSPPSTRRACRAGALALAALAHGRPHPEALGGRRPIIAVRYPAQRAGGERGAPGGHAAIRTAPDTGAGRELRRVGGPAGARRSSPARRIAIASWPRRSRTAAASILPIVFEVGPDRSGPAPEPSGVPFKSALVTFRHYDERGVYPPPAARSATPPIPVLTAAAQTLGHVTMLADRDGTTRWEAVAFEHQGRYYPSLAVLAASLATGVRGDKADARLRPGPHGRIGLRPPRSA